MPKNGPYDWEFKDNAVALSRLPGKTIVGVARDLGISAETLRSWRRRTDDNQPCSRHVRRISPRKSPLSWPNFVRENVPDPRTRRGRWYLCASLLAVMAELQRELILANTRDGLAAARARGRKGGRRPRLTADQAKQAQRLYDEGEHIVAAIAAVFGVPRTTVYGHLNKTAALSRFSEAVTMVTASRGR